MTTDAHARHQPSPRGEGGFTLLELLIVIAILPIVVGAITVGAITVLTEQPQVANRVSNSEDALIVASNYERDVQSASQITTSTSSAYVACGTGGTQLLGLQSVETQGASTTTSYISYTEVTSGSGTSTVYSLYRRYCAGSSSTIPTLSQEVAANLPPPSSQGLVTVTCAATVTCNTSQGWVPTAGFSSVSLAITAPGSPGVGAISGKYAYSLDAVPESWSPTSGGVFKGGAAITPFMILGTSSPCPNPPVAEVTISGNARITVGGGSAPVADASSCKGSISIAGSSAIVGTQITTADCNLDSVTLSGTSTAPPQVCGTVTNPFSSLQAPSNPTTGLTGSCPAGSPITGTCTPGDYSSGQALGSNANVTFGTGAAGSVFIFDQAVSITNNAKVTFDPGTYWFKQGLTIQGAAQVSFGTATYIFGTQSTSPATTKTLAISNGASVSSTSTGLLFYVEGGSLDFSGGTTSSILGEPANYGVAIWDNVQSASSYVNVSNGASTTATYGGIYIPYGEMIDTGAGAVVGSFVVTNSANVQNSGSLTLG